MLGDRVRDGSKTVSGRQIGNLFKTLKFSAAAVKASRVKEPWQYSTTLSEMKSETVVVVPFSRHLMQVSNWPGHSTKLGDGGPFVQRHECASSSVVRAVVVG